MERHVACFTCFRARHHVSHLRPANIVVASSHMKPHAGKLERKAKAPGGRTTKGHHPIQCGGVSEPGRFVFDAMRWVVLYTENWDARAFRPGNGGRRAR